VLHHPPDPGHGEGEVGMFETLIEIFKYFVATLLDRPKAWRIAGSGMPLSVTQMTREKSHR